MKKNSMRLWVILAVAAVVFTVLSFALPFAKTAGFYVSFLFGLTALAAQIYVVRSAFYQGGTVKSKFYGFPIAKIGFMYLCVQLILSLIFMAISGVVKLWIPVVLYVVLLGVAMIGFIAADAMRDEIEQQDVVLKKDVSLMRGLQSKARSTTAQCADPDMAKLLQRFSEALQYSDPVSSSATDEIEAELSSLVDELQQAVIDGDHAATAQLCNRATAVLNERNRLCKLNK